MLAHSKTVVQGSASSSSAINTDLQSHIDKLKADNVQMEREMASMSAEMASKDAEIERLWALSTPRSASGAITTADTGLWEEELYQAVLSAWETQSGLQLDK